MIKTVAKTHMTKRQHPYRSLLNRPLKLTLVSMSLIKQTRKVKHLPDVAQSLSLPEHRTTEE